MTDAVPRQFLDEFTECASDVHMDLRRTMMDLDPVVGQRVFDFLVELMRVHGPDINNVMRGLASGMMWMFMVGREHAARGYMSPVPKGDDAAEPWVPDTIAQLFRKPGDDANG